MKVEQFVASLSHDVRHEIVRTYEILEKQGSIGDEAVRVYAEKLMEEIGVPNGLVITWMEILVNACFRYYYKEMFK